MVLGLDFYDTITVAPRIYKKLARAVIDSGGEVHIITAVHKKNRLKVKGEVKQSKVPHTNLHIITFENYIDVPAFKVKKAQELKLDMYIDDRRDVCNHMYVNRIYALQSLGEPK